MRGAALQGITWQTATTHKLRTPAESKRQTQLSRSSERQSPIAKLIQGNRNTDARSSKTLPSDPYKKFQRQVIPTTEPF